MKDSSRFERFFKENYDPFFYYAYRLTDDEEASRDLVSDAFEYAWANFHNEEVDNWRAYIYSFLRNKSIDYLRHTLIKEKYADFVQRFTEECDNPEEEEEDERMEAVRRILRTLPPRTQLVLQECYLQNKKYREVAEELEISVNAVKQHIVKALRTIREEIQKKYNRNA